MLPETLVASLTLPISPVLLWDAAKYLDVVNKHARDIEVITILSVYLNEWRYHGEELGEHAGNQRILFQDETGRWYAVSVGPLQGSDNVITIIGSSRSGFLSNRLNGLNNVVKGEK